jgi:predicted cupin superfamily sugar epimerase
LFQGGLPLELVQISPEGLLRAVTLGVADEPTAGAGESPRRAAAADAAASVVPQTVVPAGSWQGARLAGGPHLPASRAWALVSCVVTPGFEFGDFELAEREKLVAAYPAHGALIDELT